jgi:hypothetical protein
LRPESILRSQGNRYAALGDARTEQTIERTPLRGYPLRGYPLL